MKLELELTPDAENSLLEQARQSGLSLESFIEQLLQERGSATAIPDIERSQTAAERIRELRRGVTLGGISIRELVEEGRE